jgi:hypothetical protein
VERLQSRVGWQYRRAVYGIYYPKSGRVFQVEANFQVMRGPATRDGTTGRDELDLLYPALIGRVRDVPVPPGCVPPPVVTPFTGFKLADVPIQLGDPAVYILDPDASVVELTADDPHGTTVWGNRPLPYDPARKAPRVYMPACFGYFTEFTTPEMKEHLREGQCWCHWPCPRELPSLFACVPGRARDNTGSGQ